MTRQGYGGEWAESIRPARACAVDAGAYTVLVFHPVVDQWFRQRYTEPTPVQAQAWPLIAAGHDVLLTAPTGSGKTLAAFLACLDRLFREAVEGRLEGRTAILYVSPLKALSNDVRRNLEEPLRELVDAAVAAGLPAPEIRTAGRTGDTPAHERRRVGRRPPHVLVTTPESLFILLTAESSRRWLSQVRTVIVDEIHAVAGDKRGAHLALSLERLGARGGAGAARWRRAPAAPRALGHRAPDRDRGAAPGGRRPAAARDRQRGPAARHGPGGGDDRRRAGQIGRAWGRER